jgi:predicted permease
MLADVRFALRLFTKSPLFTAAVVLVLGLGVGATTTVFTLVDAYLLKPLPFPEPERLVSVWRTRRPDGDGRNPFSVPDFIDLRAMATSFSHLAALRSVNVNMSEGGGRGAPAAPEPVGGSRVTADFFPALGVGAALGRTFTADEDRPGRDRVVVLSDALWRRRFGADPTAVGRTLSLDGKPYEVIGVMPPGFTMPVTLFAGVPSEMWVPAAFDGEGASRRDWHSWNVVGRLRAGASAETAGAEVRALAARLEEAHPDTNVNKAFYLLSLHEHLVGRVKPSLVLLFAATLLLLTIASANVALLLLARASARQGEVAVRAALGASRPRLVRQLLVESVLLALFGGLLGFALAFTGTGLVAAGFRDVALALREVRPDGRVLAFALALASLAGLGFGLWPAARASRARLYGLLKEGAARSTEGGRQRRLQGALLVAEIALSAVLLAGSSAVARGFYRALNAPLGFDPGAALTFRLHLPEARYDDAASARRALGGALERLRALPSVTAVGAANFIPLSGWNNNGGFEIEGRPPWPKGAEPWAEYQLASVDYFAAMRIPLRRGRAFAGADREGSAPVMLVNETFAARFFPGEDPVGKRARWGDNEPWHEIVGVVGDVQYHPRWTGGRPATYKPLAQAVDSVGQSYFVVRAAGAPGALASAARAAVAELDAELPLADVKTYDERVRDAFADRKFTLALVSAFASSALVLTALGLFGLVSYQTRRRARELAIRMALGAASADVGRLVVRDTARLLLAGLALGLPAAFAAGKLLAARLVGVPPPGPLALGGTAFVLGAAALAAVLAPARRAARTPPALVLRDE